MEKLRIHQLAKKEALWGSVDSEKVFNVLNDYVNSISRDTEIVEFDLSNITSIDYSFIKNVFIELIDSYEFLDMKFMFSNIPNFEIVYHLDEVFKIHNHTAFINIENRINSIGTNKMDIESSFAFLEKNLVK